MSEESKLSLDNFFVGATGAEIAAGKQKKTIFFFQICHFWRVVTFAREVRSKWWGEHWIGRSKENKLSIDNF
jgi:hypothetical protein